MDPRGKPSRVLRFRSRLSVPSSRARPPTLCILPRRVGSAGLKADNSGAAMRRFFWLTDRELLLLIMVLPEGKLLRLAKREQASR